MCTLPPDREQSATAEWQSWVLPVLGPPNTFNIALTCLKVKNLHLTDFSRSQPSTKNCIKRSAASGEKRWIWCCLLLQHKISRWWSLIKKTHLINFQPREGGRTVLIHQRLLQPFGWVKREAKNGLKALNRKRDERDHISDSNLLQKCQCFGVQVWEMWCKFIQSNTNHSITFNTRQSSFYTNFRLLWPLFKFASFGQTLKSAIHQSKGKIMGGALKIKTCRHQGRCQQRGQPLRPGSR